MESWSSGMGVSHTRCIRNKKKGVRADMSSHCGRSPALTLTPALGHSLRESHPKK